MAALRDTDDGILDEVDTLREQYGELDTKVVLEAVVAGDLAMGYTNPFASSTGLNFLVTVLDDFAAGDEDRLTAPDVASVFEAFQETRARHQALGLNRCEGGDLRDLVTVGEKGVLEGFFGNHLAHQAEGDEL